MNQKEKEPGFEMLIESIAVGCITMSHEEENLTEEERRNIGLGNYQKMMDLLVQNLNVDGLHLFLQSVDKFLLSSHLRKSGLQGWMQK